MAKVIEKTKPTRRLQPGDLVCGECGEGNPPPRKFCSRCGSTLESAAAVKPKWWRKLVPKRRVKTLEAGQRPGQAGVKAKRKAGFAAIMPKVRKIGGTLAILCALAFTFVAPFRDWANRTVLNPAKELWRDVTTQEFAAVRPINFTATVQTPENPVEAVFDLASNTFMVALADRGEVVITATFAEPVDIDRVIVRNGSSSQFTDFSRARGLHLVFDTGKTSDVELKDQPDPQVHTVKDASKVTRVEIHMGSKYSAVNNPAVAVSEIEFFTEK